MREQRFIDGVDGRRVGKRSKGKRIFEESPAQMLGNQRHETVVGGKLVEDIVGDKKHLLFKITDIRVAQQICVGGLKYLTRLMCDQMIPNIVLVFEIKIEGTFCNTGVIHDIRNGCFTEAVVDKK